MSAVSVAALNLFAFLFCCTHTLTHNACALTVTEAEEDERAQTVETADDDDEEESGIEMGQIGTPGGVSADAFTQQTPQPARYKALADETQQLKEVADGAAEIHEEKGLTGAQDAAIAGIMNTLGVIVSGVYWLLTNKASGGGAATGVAAFYLRWRPATHMQWWFAMLGGCMNFLHYFFFLKAFEGAPSTVLLPLVQVASVSVFLGSSVVALLRHEPWITPTHALAYLLMFIGGILPACAGNLSMLLERAFWRQNFVAFAIAAEFSLGLHDLLLSGCAYSSPAKLAAAASTAAAATDAAAAAAAGSSSISSSSSTAGAVAAVGRRLEEVIAAAAASGASSSSGGGGGGGDGESSESFEFFVWSRFSFIAAFVGIYLSNRSLYDELRDLLSGTIENKYVALSALSESLTIVGFYLASIAYGLFYQAGIVHAAEASLSQLLNLMLAYILLTCFGIGRASAVSSMRIKFISFVMVTIGLFLCTFDANDTSGKGHAAAVTAPQPITYYTVPAGYVSQTDLLLGKVQLPADYNNGLNGAGPMAATVAARMLRRRRRR